jgi:hypothetical protein
MSSSSLACRQCGEPIKFDAKHVSQRTGKKIPLDIETNEPHDCPDGEIGNRASHMEISVILRKQ